MALYNWGPSFELNVGFIDTQHSQLIDIINRLHDAMKAGQGREVIPRIIDELMAYTRKHFTEEEQWYAQNRLSSLAEHKKLHASFVKQVTDIKAKMQTPSATVSPEVLKISGDWFIRHIKGTDKEATQECIKRAA